MNDTDHEALMTRWAPTLLRAAGLPDVLPVKGDAADEGTPKHVGVMVALYPSPSVAAELAVVGGEPAGDLHVTLAYLGAVGEDVTDEQRENLLSTVTAWAGRQAPVQAILNGLGLFTTPEPVTYANVDSPQLPGLHQSLHAALKGAGLAPFAQHGFTPHMTLIYGDRRDINPPTASLSFDAVTVAWAGEQIVIPLTAKSAPAQTAFQVSERPHAVSMNVNAPPASPPAEQGRAFVTDVGGRTLITAPATAAMKEPTVEDITAEHMLWMHGRFVGAEVPNRNGALWSAGDLQMAKGSVTNGPLNWLHDARHVIGTLAQADYVDPRESAGAGISEPHITATAAIWKWIYPDEAYVIQQASEQEMLWYSMECISKEVSCAGENGCGNSVSYTDYMAGAACEHIRQRASVRQFVNPVFLGGAVIVPPTRPGWGQADARVMSKAVGLAEAAFEQAGEPDIPAATWDQLMAQVVSYAQR